MVRLPEIRVSYVDLVHVGPLEETKIYHRWGSVNQARRSLDCQSQLFPDPHLCP